MADVEYQCRVTVASEGAEAREERALGAARTPSLLLATSWLRAQASLLVWRLERDSPASAQLAAWRDDDNRQWLVAGSLVAGESVRFRVDHEEVTYELSAKRVIRAKQSAVHPHERKGKQ
ncbi:hypothetical protein [Streptomyces melanogenes]|uniref:hypothetical protein n=1 Tax=Streptomyces melanogenes TaxID=67326 RepID=UPI00167D4C16|nr:hypothetical protein [Streptomyces melanogenes]GGP37895.1 hypothetical protein GCM10010278_13590 [Streptomyces melanogenes]